MDELLQIFVDNIVPILIIAGIGFVIGRTLNVEPRPFGRVIFNAFSPALIVHSLATTEIDHAELGQLALTMALVILSLLGIAYLITGLYHTDRVGRAGVMLSAMCPNVGNLGLPLVSFAFGPSALTYAIVIYIVTTISTFTLGVLVASSGGSSPVRALLNVLRVPVLYAAAIGLILNLTGVALPLPLARSVALLGQAAIPAMLILLGLELAQSTEWKQSNVITLGAVIRLLVAPVIAGTLVLLLGVNHEVAIVIIMQASMPVAVATLIIANEFHLDTKQQLGTVLATTLFSPLTLSVLILILRRGT